MTEETEALEFIMDVRDAINTALAQNELVAQGLVTDPESIRELAQANSDLLKLWALSVDATFDPANRENVTKAYKYIVND